MSDRCLVLRHKSERSTGAGNHFYCFICSGLERDDKRKSRCHLRRDSRIRCGVGSVRFGRLGKYEVRPGQKAEFWEVDTWLFFLSLGTRPTRSNVRNTIPSLRKLRLGPLLSDIQSREQSSRAFKSCGLLPPLKTLFASRRRRGCLGRLGQCEVISGVEVAEARKSAT
jgi:hypothetical protein